jgi:ubiquinone/menaquinone biosynthesis C-methylase UbiE
LGDYATSFPGYGSIKLNLGCGGNDKYHFIGNRNDLNADLLRPSKKIPNFIICDAHNLPFREKVFRELRANHLIEHLTHPKRAINEMVRVSKKVVLAFPHFLHPMTYRDSNHQWIILKRIFIRIYARRPLLIVTRFLLRIFRRFRIREFSVTRWIIEDQA